MTMRFLSILLILASPKGLFGQESPGPLIPATTAMETAWDLPKNALDSLSGDKHLTREIVRGFKLFTHTPEEAPRLTGNALSCNNCHLNAGQREKGMPLVGIAGAFPEYNKRSGRLYSLEDRIVSCFLRSENGTEEAGAVPATPQSAEVLAISAYISWLSDGYAVGAKLPWRGQNAIASERLIPVAQLDPKRGKELFLERCVNCHGEDGQGVEIGDKKAGPLWGPQSWNDGAGAARIYTLAGMIRYMMPYLDPGSLTDEEAQQIASFINSMPRPSYPGKANDYAGDKVPSDAVYYKK